VVDGDEVAGTLADEVGDGFGGSGLILVAQVDLLVAIRGSWLVDYRGLVLRGFVLRGLVLRGFVTRTVTLV
jgi:hypothetical protein